MRSTLAVLALAALAAVQLAGCNSTTNPGGGSSNTFDSGGFTTTPFSHAFATEGVYTYKCTIHPTCGGLMGTMTVVPAEVTIQPGNHSLAISIGTGGSCYLLSPQVDSVHVGELVTWSNNTSVPHTVTSVTTP